MKSLTRDMTTGNAVKHILLFSLPALIGNIFQQVYNLADSIIVGKIVGANALAAVGASGSITFFFFALCNGIGSGGGIVASQYYGAHDEKNVKNCIVNTGLIMLLVPLIFGTVGFISAPYLLRLLGTPELILADATMYIRYMCIGLLFVSMYNYISSMLRAFGDSVSPLIFLIVSTIINILLDLLFVYKFRMGIRGAAIATLVAQFISVIGSGIYAVTMNYFSLSSEMINKILKLGIPMSLQFALIAVSTMALQRVVNAYGTAVVAAFTATSRIEQIVHQPYQTLCASLATFCGQNYGANQKDRVLDGHRKGMIMMAIVSIVMFVLMQVAGEALTSLFVSDPEVIRLGAMGLKITSFFYITLGTIYVVRGTLTGVGDAFFALFNGIIEVLGRFIVPITLTGLLGMGVKGIWLSTGLVWAVSGITAWMRYYSRLHEKKDSSRIIDRISRIRHKKILSH